MIGGLAFNAAVLMGTGPNDGFIFTFPFVTREDMGTANIDVPSGDVTKAM